MTPFSFLTAGRIIFGRGTADQAVAAVTGFGSKVLLVRGASVPWVDGFESALSAAGADVTTVLCRAEPDLPALEAALDAGRSAGAEVVVSVGGGAVIDMGKALAALLPANTPVLDHLEGVGAGKPLTEPPLPFVALPTTAGTGAEVTRNAVISVPEAGRKVSLRDDRMLPDVAIVDPALTDHAPRQVTLASGLDAVTQCIEPWLSTRANPMTDALCEAAIPAGLRALVRLEQGEDKDARDTMAWCSLAGGLALANSGLGAVHGLAGVLGGRLGAPHGLICGRLLGPVLAANAAHMADVPEAQVRFGMVGGWLASAFQTDAEDAFSGLGRILDTWQMPRLGEWLTADTDLNAIAAEAAGASSMKANPCTLNPDELVSVVRQAM
ncbi:iron-containing alcohol dehydrogenase [Roseobacter ponti]|uniref:Iron-containing alcohol dehydrogenase n=1 Tax=Roseobacter ponti TaxID=1891787 RepID=A0A858SSS6_9RHOB|nr:iron-containing alcohol dehydrogenase [Roseobacter ponti]QJF51725.1 iron-containing alcohol dehydrogenase [Roseobacter ponti]